MFVPVNERTLRLLDQIKIDWLKPYDIAADNGGVSDLNWYGVLGKLRERVACRAKQRRVRMSETRPWELEMTEAVHT